MTDPIDASPPLPGRAVDIVHAACVKAGHIPTSMHIEFNRDGALTWVTVHFRGRFTAAQGREVFSWLGVHDAVFTPVPGYNHARLDARALGVHVHLILDPEPVATEVEPTDVAALVADVDALRDGCYCEEVPA